MEDEEVGSLWYATIVPNPSPTELEALQDAAIKKLIHKLVAERAEFYAKGFTVKPEDIKDALNDFKINPVSWK